MIGLDSDPLKNRRQFHGKARVQKNNAQIQQLMISALHENNGCKPNNRSAGICEKVMKRPLVHNAIHVARWGGCSKNYCSPNSSVLERLAFWGKGTQLAILVSYKELIFRDQDKIIDKTIRYFSFHLFVYISKRKIPMQKFVKISPQNSQNRTWQTSAGTFSAVFLHSRNVSVLVARGTDFNTCLWLGFSDIL